MAIIISTKHISAPSVTRHVVAECSEASENELGQVKRHLGQSFRQQAAQVHFHLSVDMLQETVLAELFAADGEPQCKLR